MHVCLLRIIRVLLDISALCTVLDKIPIVPLSIANAYTIMPQQGFVPNQTGKGNLRVYVHEPIEVDGEIEEQILEEVKKALLSELPRISTHLKTKRPERLEK